MARVVDNIQGRWHRRAFLLLVVCMAVSAWIAWPTVSALLYEWNRGLYSHGWLVFALSLFYLFRLETRPTAGRWLSLVVALLSAFTWWFGLVLGIETIQYAALYGLLLSLILSIWGFPFLYDVKYMMIALAMAFPVWEHIQAPLQRLSTEISVIIVDLLGINIHREGFLLSVPGGRFLIEPACAGLGFLLTALSLVLLFAAWFKLHWKQLFKMLIVSLLLAMLANWIRVVIIVLIGNYTEMQSPLVEDHFTLGWLIFGVIYCPYYWFQVRTVGDERRHVAPFYKSIGYQDLRWPLGVVAIVAAFPVLNACVGVTQGSRSSNAHSVMETYQGQSANPVIKLSVSPKKWHPEISGADSEGFYRIHQDGYFFTAFVVETNYYPGGRMLPKSGNKVFDSRFWSMSDETLQDSEMLLKLSSARGQYRNIVYSYIINGEATGDVLEAKKLVLDAYLDNNPRMFFIAVMVDHGYITTPRVSDVALKVLKELTAHFKPYSSHKPVRDDHENR